MQTLQPVQPPEYIEKNKFKYVRTLGSGSLGLVALYIEGELELSVKLESQKIFNQ